ncbi:MAG: SBBP repeat-containing protein [Candidatus Eremiobacteraeota bacterium]|nr:SBBP repeat-containing protein [Candidatus Eremiobacteraeota bacterium]MBV8366934.1 SBBP repeat-containing protein [Candidatus Eremiobacteraeota bacterium]
MISARETGRVSTIIACALLMLLLSACSSSSTTPAPPAHTQQLYVTDVVANAVYIFPLTATGAAAPTATIQGAATGLSSPFGVAVDSSGNVYVANEGSSSITEYAAGTSGNVAPTKTISGASTGMLDIRGIAVDSSGNIYVGDTTAHAIWIFGAAQTGNVAPASSIVGAATTLSFPGGVAVDASGKVYVGDQTGAAILEWTAGHTGNVAPDNTVTGVNGAYLLQVANNNIYIAGQSSGVYVFPVSATGAATPAQFITGGSTTLGAGTRAAAADASGNIYAANGSVPKFASGSTGNVAPTTTLTVPTNSEGVTVF